MATRISLGEAVELDLPGRRSREIVSGKGGADSTLRLVEIAVPEPGAAPREPHWHPDSEEVIHVLEGEGVTFVDGAEFEMRPGDTIRIAPGERHVTRNSGDKPLKMLCYFPRPTFRMLTGADRDD
jgi:oxalate decarboxylase/phosphoglucose isomerase-like protein (cupin superfamily)